MLQAFQLFADNRKYFRKLVDLAMVSLTKDGVLDEGFSLSAYLINFVWQNNGVQPARDLYKRYVTKY